jgi:hypothetical protein
VFAAIASNMVRVFAGACENRAAAKKETTIAMDAGRRIELFIDEQKSHARLAR